MKKSIMFVLVLGLMVIGFHSVSAASCDVNNPCGGNGNPSLVVGGWGTVNGAVPSVSQGQTVRDDNGIPATCQWATGCVDIFHTDWYKTQIANLKSQLGDASFNLWVNLARK